MTTLFYSNHLFGRAEPGLEHLAERGYDFTFLCAPDFPFMQDGTRQPETFRMLQHEWYVRELAKRRIAYELVGGPLDQRIQQIRKLLAI